MKILLLMSASLFVTGALIGSNCCFDCFYFGGAIGGTLLDGRQSGEATGVLTEPDLTRGGADASNIYTSDPNSDYFAQDWSGALFAGFGYHYCIFYAGVEVFGQYSRLHSSFNLQNNNEFPAEAGSEGISVNNHVRIGPWQYGIDLRPGILLTPTTLLYGRVGVTGTTLKSHTDIENSFVLAGVGSPVSISNSTHKHGHYLRLGLGIEKLICSHFGLRLEYIFTDYRSLFLEGSNSGPSADATLDVSASHKVHLRTSELRLALAYYFSSCCPQDCCFEPNFCGWYLGAGLGGGFNNDCLRIQTLNIAPGPESAEEGIHSHNFSTNLNEKSIRAMFWGGYGLQFNCPRAPLFMGLELFGQYSPHHTKLTNTQLFSDGFSPPTFFTADTTARVRTKIQPWQYGIQARPGILLTPSTLLFGTVGMSIAKLEVRYDAQFDNPTAGITFPLSLHTHHTRPVLRVGGGVEYGLNWCDWHLRADYIYTDYRSLRIKGSTSFVPASTTPVFGTLSLSTNSRIHLQDHAITIGLTKYL